MNLLFHPNKKVQAHSISSERDETYPELKFKNPWEDGEELVVLKYFLHKLYFVTKSCSQ